MIKLLLLTSLALAVRQQTVTVTLNQTDGTRRAGNATIGPGPGNHADNERARSDHHKKDAVAVCVAGQARTFNASAVYRSIHETMVGPLRDARHRVDVFLALDRGVDHQFDYVTNPLAPDLIERLRPVAYDWTSVSEKSMAEDVCDEQCGIWGMGCKGIGQTTHQAACLRDIERQERIVGTPYAWVLLGRPDVAIGRSLTTEALDAAARAAASSRNGNGTVFSGTGRCHASTYCHADTWSLATRRAADVYVHTMAREFRRRTGCVEARRSIVAALDGTGAKVNTKTNAAGVHTKSVCPECRLAYTLRTNGVELCGANLHKQIVRSRSVRADGSVSGLLAQLGNHTIPVRFEHPGPSGTCDASHDELENN